MKIMVYIIYFLHRCFVFVSENLNVVAIKYTEPILIFCFILFLLLLLLIVFYFMIFYPKIFAVNAKKELLEKLFNEKIKNIPIEENSSLAPVKVRGKEKKSMKNGEQGEYSLKNIYVYEQSYENILKAYINAISEL